MHLIHKFIRFNQSNSTKSNETKFSLKTKTNKIFPLTSKRKKKSNKKQKKTEKKQTTNKYHSHISYYHSHIIRGSFSFSSVMYTSEIQNNKLINIFFSLVHTEANRDHDISS